MFIPHILLTGAFALVGVLHTLFQSSAVLFNYPSLGLLSDVPVLAYFISYEISVSSLPELVQTPPASGPVEEEEVGEQCIWGIPGLLVPRAPAFARPGVVSLSPHVVITSTPYKPQVQRAKTTVLHNITTQPICSPMIISMCQRKESYNIAPFARVEVLSHKVPEKRAQASWVHKLLHLVFLIFASVFLCISFMVYLVGGINLSDLKTQPRKVTQKPQQKQTKVYRYEECPSISLTLEPTIVPVPVIDGPTTSLDTAKPELDSFLVTPSNEETIETTCVVAPDHVPMDDTPIFTEEKDAGGSCSPEDIEPSRPPFNVLETVLTGNSVALSSKPFVQDVLIEEPASHFEPANDESSPVEPAADNAQIMEKSPIVIIPASPLENTPVVSILKPEDATSCVAPSETHPEPCRPSPTSVIITQESPINQMAETTNRVVVGEVKEDEELGTKPQTAVATSNISLWPDQTQPPKRTKPSKYRARKALRKQQAEEAEQTAAAFQYETRTTNKPRRKFNSETSRPQLGKRISTDTINRTVFRHLQTPA